MTMFMIDDPKVRDSLNKLVYGTKGKQPAIKYSVDIAQGNLIQNWMDQHRKELKPFIPLVTSQENGVSKVSLGESARGIVEVGVYVRGSATPVEPLVNVSIHACVCSHVSHECMQSTM